LISVVRDEFLRFPSFSEFLIFSIGIKKLPTCVEFSVI
jgi:hypothetical protein